MSQGSGGKPDSIGKADDDRVVISNQRVRAEQSVAETSGLRLYNVTNFGRAGGAFDAPPIIFENVRFPRRDYKTELIYSGEKHSFDQIFADRARPLMACAIDAAADR